MPALEDDLRLEQLKKLRMQPSEPDVVPPSQAMVPPDRTPYTQAAELERQAAPPRDPTQGMSPLKAMLYKGLQGAAGGAIHAQEPGGYTQYLQDQQQTERQRENDLYARAKGLRAEGADREQDYLRAQEGQMNREQQMKIATMPKPQEDFTLSADQIRFGPGGNEIAHGAPRTNTTAPHFYDMEEGGQRYRVFYDSDPTHPTSKLPLGPAQAKSIPGSMMPTVDAQGNITSMVNTETGAITPAKISPGVQGPVRRTAVAPGVMKDERDLANSVENINQLGTIFKDEFVGPVAGRVNTVKSKLPGSVASLPEGYADFSALQAQLKNSVIKLITGAQMGQQEAERILQQVPTENDRPDVWKAKYGMTKQNAERLYNMIQNQTGTTPNGNPPGGNSNPPLNPPVPIGGGETRIVNGVTYQKVGTEWHKK